MASSRESNGPEELKRDSETADQNSRAILDVVEAIGEAQNTEEVIDGAATDIEPAPPLGGCADAAFILGMGKVGDEVKILLNIAKVLGDDRCGVADSGD